MANPDGYPREMHVKLDSGTGTITFRENSSNRVLDYEFAWDENYPKKVTVAIDNTDTTAANNLLNSSCSLWSSGTAALALGDKLRFGLYQSDGSTVDVQFDGIITQLDPMADGILVVVAYDPSKRLEYEHRTFTHGANYRDERILQVTTSGSVRYIGGVSDSDVVEPLATVGFAHTDYAVSLGGDNDNDNNIIVTGEYVDQAFIAEYEYILGCHFHWNSDWGIGGTSDIDVKIYTDNDNTPSTLIHTESFTISHGDSSPRWVDFTTSSVPIRLAKGQKYWLRIERTGGGGGTVWNVVSQDTNLTYFMDEFYHYDTGVGSRTAVANELLELDLYFTEYVSLGVSDYWFDDSNDRVYLTSEAHVIDSSAHSSTFTIHRGLVSYYYGTLTKEEVCERLITANTGLLKDLSTNLDRTFDTYSTRGKSLGDCLREIMDVYENSGTWDGYQSTMAHYLDGSSIDRLKVGKRKKTSDSATYILSHGNDTANDDEHIIMEGGVSLKQTNRMKYARVIMIGEAEDGEPLVCAVSDQALSGSFHSQMGGLAETMVVTDKNLNSLVDVNKAAYSLMDAIQRDVWEGTILCSGQHEDMMDWNTANDTYGSGNIITVNYSPLGISATKFKVKGMVMSPLTTEIYISNVDPLLNNRLTEGWGREKRSESFHAPVGTPSAVYGYTYTTTVITIGPAYMELCDSSGTALSGQERALCRKFQNADYNMNVYHAEFPAGVAYSGSIGGVGQVKLYTTRTGGTATATIDLTRTESSIVIDEEVDKFKSQKLIFEVMCPQT